ncbi:MAG TPA: PaaI family thioesterase [Myxococcales bacterium]|nr:PaaI family thioesterase [Myxococcales bacterium]
MGMHLDNFGQFLGYQLLPPSTPDELPRVQMTIEERHLSSAGVAHGGAVFSLMDFAFGAILTLTRSEDNEHCSTVGLHIEYLKPVPLGTVATVTTYIEHRGRSLVRVRGELHDQNDLLLAYATGVFNLYRRKS